MAWPLGGKLARTWLVCRRSLCYTYSCWAGSPMARLASLAMTIPQGFAMRPSQREVMLADHLQVYIRLQFLISHE